MRVHPEARVADLASEHPSTIRVFQRYEIDFCCGGRRALDEVCARQGLSLADLTRDLEAALATPGEPGPAWDRGSLRQVVSGIVERYHRPLDAELPRLDRMLQKVLGVHGGRHPELEEVAATFGAIVADLGPHMMKEEHVLFPFVVRLEAASESGEALPAPPFGSVQIPVDAMESEHQVVGAALARLRDQTRGYDAPADACNTFRGLYHGLAELERDLHEHIHVENNILFPRALRLERDLSRPARSKV